MAAVALRARLNTIVRLLEGGGGVLKLLVSLCIGLILVSQATSAQTPSAVSTADRHHPFVEHAERRYRQYLASESQGDTAAYKQVRTRQAYETTIEQLKKRIVSFDCDCHCRVATAQRADEARRNETHKWHRKVGA